MYKQRWSEVFADPTGAAFAQIVSPDLTLEGSILARPVHGPDAVWTVLTTASDVYDTLAFTAAIHHRPLGAVLAFSKEMKKRLSDRIEPVYFL
jgi:hypothetical protein